MIYTAKELMEILKIKESLCYKLLREGEIKAFKMGSDWKIPKQSLEEYIARQLKV
ncbi:DNA binding domain-containing protein, excisionase family [Natronincola peptidivorans]|uniref:DNA binding domain-containing protein, excisionase family n=1 Tax=Natronincola peptidivorans TaxID=426128 RepID=A0A1I0E050_9FIRM|nr:helix-turn-helix domain-containing protein [Natronincola peptidivorans]SET38383.1 DNA binding domain-containing protein, excisionase family [Natronincola peptidivorans]